MRSRPRAQLQKKYVNTQNLLNSAREARDHNQIPLAVRLYMETLDLDPECVAALTELGGLVVGHGRPNEGEQLLRKAIEIDPDSFNALKWLTTLTIGRAGGIEAVKFGLRAIQVHPDDAQAHVALGLAQLGAGQNEFAISSFERAISLSPEMAGAYHNLGVAYQREERFDQAIEAFQNAIKNNPKLAESHLHLARTFLANQQGGAALASAKIASELLPNSLAVKRVLTAASYTAVISDRKSDYIGEAIANTPNSAFLHALKASRLQDDGDFTGAEASLNESIRLNPKQGFAYYVLSHNRKLGEADRTLFDKAASFSSDPTIDRVERQYLNYGLGKYYDDLGEFERAIHSLDLANEAFSDINDLVGMAEADRHSQRVDGIIKMVSNEFLSQLDNVGLESHKPIFIVGMPRSGTTLLEQILSRHSQIGAAGELPFWRDSSRRIINLHTEEFQVRELLSSAERYLDLLHKISPDSGRVTDKFPSNYLFIGLLKKVFPNGKIIHARRNPIDTCLSIYMRPFFASHFGGSNRERIVENYRGYQRLMAHWKEVLPQDSFLDMDYESLVGHPEQETKRLIEFLDLEWDENCLHPEKGDRSVITFSKWQVRQPVYTSSVARWKRYEPWLGVFGSLQADDLPPLKE